jgi:hypothetical protein
MPADRIRKKSADAGLTRVLRASLSVATLIDNARGARLVESVAAGVIAKYSISSSAVVVAIVLATIGIF